MGIRFQSVMGGELSSYKTRLAELRIEVFREFPYLYEGTISYESDYLKVYEQCSRSLVVFASTENDQIVGASTCIPLQDAGFAFQKPFRENGFDLDGIFYFGESVVKKEFRGRGIGRRFFKEREGHAQRTLENLKFTTFCAVNRPVDHPLRPEEYRPLDGFWAGQGYQRHPELVITFPWLDIDQPTETVKTLTYWIKSWV